MNKSLNDIKQIAIPILKNAGITHSAIFGSYARGENTPDSDIDILIEVPQGMTLFDLGGLQMDLEEALGKKVDLIDFKTIKTFLKPYILNNQIKII